MGYEESHARDISTVHGVENWLPRKYSMTYFSNSIIIIIEVCIKKKFKLKNV